MSFLSRLSVLFELLVYAALYFAFIGCDLLAQADHLEVPVEMKDLSQKMSVLKTFLLAFYVCLSMTRWWTLRTDGVGGIWSANDSIATLLGVIYHSTKRVSPSSAANVLSAIERIRRYSAASLYYFFLQCGQHGFDEDGLLRLGLLTQTELQTMQSLPGSQSKYLWAVIGTECGEIANTLLALGPKGLDPRLVAVWSDKLTDLWMRGRSGAGLTAMQLGCKLLFDYSAMVSLIIRVTMVSIIWVHAIQAAESHSIDFESEHLHQSALTILAELLPLLFYALMHIAVVNFAIDAQSPFNDAETAFPGCQYVNGLLEDFSILCNIDVKKEKGSMTAWRGNSGAGPHR